jgi:hypothetical protein
MKSEEFNKCREFLENQIQAATDETYRSNLLQAYQKLLELKSIYDKDTDRALIEKEIKQAEFEAQTSQIYNTNYHATQQNWQNNQSCMNNNWNDNLARTKQNYDNNAFGLISNAISQI